MSATEGIGDPEPAIGLEAAVESGDAVQLRHGGVAITLVPSVNPAVHIDVAEGWNDTEITLNGRVIAYSGEPLLEEPEAAA